VELNETEKNFLVGILTNVVPNLSVPAKEALAMLELAQGILEKLQPTNEA
jgi:hypothetical protein